MNLHQLAAPQRSHARSNRARILAAAREQFAGDPDASLEEIARAGGVARRTLYGHFPNRQALIFALAEEATGSVEEALATARRPGDDAVSALARMTLAVWAVGDGYRMLIALARRDLGEEGFRAAIAPVRSQATSILERGQRDGSIAGHLPAPVLARALEALTLSLLEAQNSSGWEDPAGEAAAVAGLLAVGVAEDAARERVRAMLAGQG